MSVAPDNTVEGLWDCLEEIATALDAPREDLLVLLVGMALYRDGVLDPPERERLRPMLVSVLDRDPNWPRSPAEALLRFGGAGRA